jgi:hypothetical protein
MAAEEKVKAQLVIVTGLLVMYFVFKSVYLLYAATAVGLISLAIPFLGDLLVKGWFKLAEVLGMINGRILLSLIFFVVLFPIALLYRMGRKNPLSLKREPGESAFATRNHLYTAKDLENVW